MCSAFRGLPISCATLAASNVSAWTRSLSIASKVFCRASVASCRIMATPAVPIARPSNGAV